jgi:hypothetical protein
MDRTPDNVESFDQLDLGEAIRLERPVLLDPDNTRSWTTQAACLQIYGDSNHRWCGERAESRTVEKTICWTECPVRRECLTWAIAEMEKYCVFGGYNYGERRLIWREWREQKICPEYDRTHVDQDAIYQLISESSIAQVGALPIWNPRTDSMEASLEDDFDSLEPDDDDLKAIEEEELVES